FPRKILEFHIDIPQSSWGMTGILEFLRLKIPPKLQKLEFKQKLEFLASVALLPRNDKLGNSRIPKTIKI
ncbi:MAG: hypothetical protein PUJ19_03435, partial [Campylobacteraceae bacterium]|nr:hypothetical protein [Campylobacteraceae bacterium]MDY4120662.1 hypothetical protein [Campylobacter sp.]